MGIQAGKENAKELENECVENASAALSRLLKKKVVLSKARIKLVKKEGLPAGICKPRELTANIQFGIVEGVTGAVVLALKREDGLRLIEMCAGRKKGSLKTLAGMELSAFLEIGNILTANLIATIANFFGLKIMHTPPSPVFNIAENIANFAHIGRSERMGNAFVVRMALSAGRRKIPINYIVLLSDRSLEKLEGLMEKNGGKTPPHPRI